MFIVLVFLVKLKICIEKIFSNIIVFIVDFFRLYPKEKIKGTNFSAG
jgi:hypothetical protein